MEKKLRKEEKQKKNTTLCQSNNNIREHKRKDFHFQEHTIQQKDLKFYFPYTKQLKHFFSYFFHVAHTFTQTQETLTFLLKEKIKTVYLFLCYVNMFLFLDKLILFIFLKVFNFFHKLIFIL